MLVLSRKLGERIVINPGPRQVVVTLVDIDRGKVRLGVEAPHDVAVFREEIVPPVPPAPPADRGDNYPAEA